MDSRQTKNTRGIHHITAISGSAQHNYRFYTQVLGLRLVKKTVNFDDPGTYHLYYGDDTGTPGTILTFFPWEKLHQGRPGAGQVTAVGFTIPKSAAGFWTQRLSGHDIPFSEGIRFGETIIGFSDPDGLPLELIAVEAPPELVPWTQSPVPPEVAIRGFHSATATLHSATRTAGLLTEVMGMQKIGSEGNRTRYRMGSGSEAGAFYDVVEDRNAAAGLQGGGTVHHIAFRAIDDEDQEGWREAVYTAGLSPTPIIDRKYFHSIYFREFGGVLFEMATDPPGFALDESPERLGGRLMLPEMYEPRRKEIENSLPPLATEPDIVHVYKPARRDGVKFPTIVAFHGTGGNEHDLVPLAGEIAGGHRAILSPRGQVNENGMLRFFKRFAEGIFDDADVRQRADEMANFILAADLKYDRREHGLTALGYSNGANIAAAVMLLRPEVFRSAVLLRPMLPVTPDPLPDLSGVRILVIRGEHDPVIPAEGTDALVRILEESGADVTVETVATGHALTGADVAMARDWLEKAECRIAAEAC